MGELHIVEETACWERKFMLFKVYSRQSVGMSSRPNFAQSGVLLHIVMGTGPLRRCWRILFATKGTEPAVNTSSFLHFFYIHAEEAFRVASATFYQLDALPVTQPTVSKLQRNEL